MNLSTYLLLLQSLTIPLFIVVEGQDYVVFALVLSCLRHVPL